MESKRAGHHQPNRQRGTRWPRGAMWLGVVALVGCSSEVTHASGAGDYPAEGGSGGSEQGGGADGEATGGSAAAACDFTATTCRIRFRCCGNSYTPVDTLLEVRQLAERHHEVADGLETDTPWVESVLVGDDGVLHTTAGVPEVTCTKLLDTYTEVMDEGTDVYEQVDGYQCTEADTALVRFFILEWFYFG